MQVSTLSPAQRQFRANIRNFLFVAKPEELRRELSLSLERQDYFRAECIIELMQEDGIDPAPAPAPLPDGWQFV